MATPEHLSGFGKETPSIQDAGVSLDTVSRLARLGLVLEESRLSHGDGSGHAVAVFSFMPESPLGRANRECDLDVDILNGIIEDAKHLSYEDFVARFPHFGPYDEGLKDGNA